jgi:DNA-binding response OmpR family regulator
VGHAAALIGHSILVLEDEPLIALEITHGLHVAGASVFCARSVRDALPLAEHPDLSAAILDFGLSDSAAGTICQRLVAREIPFVLYSGYLDVKEVYRKSIHLPKPAATAELVSALVRLLH